MGRARMRGAADGLMAARLLDVDCLIADFRRTIPADSTTAMAIDGRAPRLAIARIARRDGFDEFATDLETAVRSGPAPAGFVPSYA